MDNPEVLWVILLVGYFIFSAILRGLRQQRNKGGQAEEEAEKEQERPWWEENWPDWEDDEQKANEEERKQPDTSGTEQKPDRETLGERKNERTGDVTSTNREGERLEKPASEKVDSGHAEYQKPSYESSSEPAAQIDKGQGSYRRPEKQPFERHRKKPYKRQDKNSWAKAEREIYNWEKKWGKSKKRNEVVINARKAVVHYAIFHRPYE